jgi:hypothetical protein
MHDLVVRDLEQARNRTLGLTDLDDPTLVHVSYFEAKAYARWADVPDYHLVDVANGVVTVTELEA